MKYLSIGAGILAVLLALCIGSSVLLCRSTRESEALLQQAEAALLGGDTQTAAARAQAAETAFVRRREVLGALLSHEELDAVSIAFSDLRVYAAEGSREEYRARCGELLFRLRHIAELDAPFYYNFL